MVPIARIAILRLSGEVSTKARATRQRFVTRLVGNVKDALQSEGIAAPVERSHERLYVELAPPSDAPPRADAESRGVAALTRVFGVQSVSLASRVAYTVAATVASRPTSSAAHSAADRRRSPAARTPATCPM